MFYGLVAVNFPAGFIWVAAAVCVRIGFVKMEAVQNIKTKGENLRTAGRSRRPEKRLFLVLGF